MIHLRNANYKQVIGALRSKFIELPDHMGRLCETLNRSQRFYFWGFAFVALCGFWYITPFADFFLAAAIAAAILLLCGIVSDLLALYKATWETAIGRGLLLLLLAFATNLAYSASSRLVNELVKFDVASLTYTVNFVAFLLVPVFVFIGAVTVFTVVLIAAQFYLLFAFNSNLFRNSKCLGSLMPAPTESYPGTTLAARLIAFPVVLGASITLGDRAAPIYERFIEKAAAAFIFHIDSARYSRCEVLPGERVVKVNDQEILVVTNVGGTIKFSPTKCTLTIKP